MPNQEKIRMLGENKNDKYFGILEMETIKRIEMKQKIRKEYFKQTRKLLKIERCSNNFIKGTILLVRYSGLFLKLTRGELR